MHDESVGPAFKIDYLQQARDKTLQLIELASRQIRPGMSEADAKQIVLEIQHRLGAPRHWHPPQIRFGKNTLMPFGEPGAEGMTLAENDIYFLDIGPIFDGHEGDVGRPFTVGFDPEMRRCCTDAEAIWHEVKAHWEALRVSGRELYAFAQKCASEKGWQLTLENASGHRIADFPHAIRIRGSMDTLDQAPAANRWILEIQIRHPSRPFGAFYEDLLN